MSLGAGSSNAASSSVGAEVLEAQAFAGAREGDVGYGANGGFGGAGDPRRAVVKVESKGVSFVEHTEVGEDSDDDMVETAFEARNMDIAPYAGKLTREGLLLPVSLPGLRDLPPEYEAFERRGVVQVSDGNPALPIPGTKDEPMEIDSVGVEPHAAGALHPDMFTSGTVAHKVLSSDSLMFLQIPGLLALTEDGSAPRYNFGEEDEEPKVESSVAAAEAAAERMRGLGTDLRRVGERGSKRAMGKLRFYKSGRVQIVMDRGGSVDVEHGVAPKVCQQVVQINTRLKTCEEFQSTLSSRLVGVPCLGPT